MVVVASALFEGVATGQQGVVRELESETSGVVYADTLFSPQVDVICYTDVGFQPLAARIEEHGLLQNEVDSLREANAELEKALAASKAESASLRQAVTLLKQNVELERQIAENNHRAFIETDELLKKERKRNLSWIAHGPSVGVVLPFGQDGDFGEVAAAVGYSFVWNMRRKK